MSEGKYSHLAKMHKAIADADKQLDKIFDALDGDLVETVELRITAMPGEEPKVEYLVKTNNYLLDRYGNGSRDKDKQK